jgi:hypothetical protein
VIQLPEEAAKDWLATTDDQGQCTIKGLPLHGQVQLQTTDEKFARLSYQDRIPLEAATTPPPIHLVAAASIVATVTNPETGKPAAGVKLQAQGTDNNRAGGWATGVTDENGTCKLGRLRPGPYAVTMAPNGPDDPWTAKSVEVELEDGGQKPAEIVLTHGGFVAGTVHEKGSTKPIAGVWIGV